MRKVLVVAVREYNAAVRTKAFLIGLMMMPLLMGGSFLLQWLLRDTRDIRDKRIVVVDRTPGAILVSGLKRAIETANEAGIDPNTGERIRPRIIIDSVTAPPDDKGIEELRQELAAQARKGQLTGWLVIGPKIADIPEVANPAVAKTIDVSYETLRLPDQVFLEQARAALTRQVRALRAKKAGIDLEKLELVSQPLLIDTKRESWQASLIVPMVLMMMMFMLILMTAMPLMQGVVEEKMQRIAEVLLGSVLPFQLMLGKLLGMTGVSMTISAVYLGGAYWAAHSWGMGEAASWSLIAWFLLFQLLASLMYGALFIAVGAACTDMRETQNLVWPVTLLATMPMFLLGQVLREPNSSVVMGLSFFPFATPSLMIARQAVPPGVPVWQPIVGVVAMLSTTLVCVWVAGRIFRVGILLMGKGANLIEMGRWVLRG
jgi:ABC-type Na+ efflux pump permease subunit